MSPGSVVGPPGVMHSVLNWRSVVRSLFGRFGSQVSTTREPPGPPVRSFTGRAGEGVAEAAARAALDGRHARDLPAVEHALSR